jgi:hypothetical protein
MAIADSTSTPLENVVITGISPGSVLVDTVIMFDDTVPAAVVQAFMDRMAQNPADAAWLFPSQPQLLTMLGTPSVIAVDSGLVHNILAATCTRPVRPPTAVYAPASASLRQFPLLITLTATWDPLSLDTCGPKLACLFAFKNGEVVTNSLRGLDTAGLQWVADVTVSNVNAPVDILLLADVCNPNSSPEILTVASDLRSPSVRARFHHRVPTSCLSVALPTCLRLAHTPHGCPPTTKTTQVSLVLEDAPSLDNSTFTVRAKFSERVQPLLPLNFTASGAVVRRVVFEGTDADNANGSSALVVLDGTPGVTVSLQLLSGAYADMAQVRFPRAASCRYMKSGVPRTRTVVSTTATPSLPAPSRRTAVPRPTPSTSQCPAPACRSRRRRSTSSPLSRWARPRPRAWRARCLRPGGRRSLAAPAGCARSATCSLSACRPAWQPTCRRRSRRRPTRRAGPCSGSRRRPSRRSPTG